MSLCIFTCILYGGGIDVYGLVAWCFYVLPYKTVCTSESTAGWRNYGRFNYAKKIAIVSVASEIE